MESTDKTPEERERELIGQRRTVTGDVDPQRRPWALALSGGGIRSATFCLGLVRSLAKNDLFTRFDYLSTVSGGGYVGSAIGRLFSPLANAQRVNDGLKDDNSLFLWWLRSNGRFLLPAGFRDTVNAAASYLRGLLATHLEIGVLSLLLSCVVVLPHLVALNFDVVRELGSGLPSPLWLVFPALGIAALALLAAYWFCRDDDERIQRISDGFVVVVSTLLMLLMWRAGDAQLGAFADQRYWWAALASVPLLGYALCALARTTLVQHPDAVGWRCLRVPSQQGRVRVTAWFGWLINLAGGVLVFGLLDFLTWVVAAQVGRGDSSGYAGGIGITVLVLLALRIVVPILQKKLATDRLSLPLANIANVAGLLLTLVLIALWMIAAQWYVFMPATGKAFPFLQESPGRWALLFSVLALYALLTRCNRQQVNRSSLHPFYRSRIARAYVSTGNSPDHAVKHLDRRFQVSPLLRAERSSTEIIGKINEFWEGDDIALGAYEPHRYGGPIHLVGCCINQTVDDRTGTYNADRKGVSLTVSALGLEIGTKRPYDDGEILKSGLAQWIAVSGAAIGPGMGSASRYGISALSFLTGTRLGYWWYRAASEFPRRPGKYAATLREWLGQFPGLHSSPLYVSDGGHFDNTGVYTLLKRQPELIVLADCGADPRYLFGDVENLIRKARIDYNARIEFLQLQKPGLAIGLQDLVDRFGTPDSITPGVGNEFLLLARIVYDGGDSGLLLVVKPRRVQSLSLDIAGYSDRDTLFPQQGTGDQFFDESQWDSYCELGGVLGSHIDARLVEALPELAKAARTAESRNAAPAATDPASRRERFLTLGKTLGIGAALSVAVAGWQLWRDARADEWKSMADRTQSINVLADPTDKGRIARLLNAELHGWKSEVADLIVSLEAIGSLHGARTQESARTHFAQALHRACEGRSPDSTATEDARARDNCRYALATLAPSRRPFWGSRVESYWERSNDGGARNACTEEGSPRDLFIHGGELDAGTRLGLARDFPGLRVRTGPAPTTDPDWARQLAEGFVRFSSPKLLANEFNRACADAVNDLLRTRYDEVAVVAAPGFGYAGSELHLWLSAVQAPNLTQQLPPMSQQGSQALRRTLTATGASPFAISNETILPSTDGGDAIPDLALAWPAAQDPSPPPAPPRVEIPPPPAPPATQTSPPLAVATPVPQRYRVYIQFQGRITRDQINRLRAYLAVQGDNGKYEFELPPAERLAGRYADLVKYFSDDDRDAAHDLLERTRAALFEGQCTGNLPQQPMRANGASPPATLELWLSDRKCEGFKLR